MLSGSVVPSNHRHPCPGGVAAVKEFCSRAIPGPGPSQNPALSGTPAPKVHAPFNLKGKRTVISRTTVTSCRHVQHSCGSPSRQRSCVSKNCHTTFAVRSPRYGSAVLISGRYSVRFHRPGTQSNGPFRPRPRRPSAHPQRRSLPLLQGAKSLPSAALQSPPPHTSRPPPGPTLHFVSRPWSLGDSKTGIRPNHIK